MKISLLVSFLLAVGVCRAASASEATLILVNAKVWTENPAQPTPQAVALDGSRILAVGDNAAIRKLAGPDTRIIDLGGRLLLPGFNDAHVHFLVGGGSLDHACICAQPTATPSSSERIAQFARRCPKVRGFAMAFGIISAGIRPSLPDPPA